MTTALWVAGHVAGALVMSRAGYVASQYLPTDSEIGDMLRDIYDEPPLAVLMALFWPFAFSAALVAALGGGFWALVTRPTARERREKRMEAAEREREHVRREARRLGLPLVEDGDRG